MRGATPKDDADRVRRNPPIYEEIKVEWDGVVRGPKLPKRYGPCPCGGKGKHQRARGKPGQACNQQTEVEWHPATVDWYEKWRRTPQSMVFTDTDWEFFAQTALLHDRYWSEECKPSELVSLAGEIRRREEAYGGTFEARRKLRLKVDSPQHRAGKEAQIRTDAAGAVNYAEKLTQAAAEIRSKDASGDFND